MTYRPTSQHSPERFIRQARKHLQAQIQIVGLASHTSIHDLHVHTPIPAYTLIISRNPNLLPTQWIVIRIRARGRCIPYDMRYRTYGIRRGILVAACAVTWTRAVVRQITGKNTGIGW
jgi:hypothetical protein